MISRIGGVLWDWNGTLLNDTQLAVRTINEMLGKRNLPLLSVADYQDVFKFPVRDYYQKIGFDFESEPFEIPATEFIVRYNEQVNDCSLHADSLRVLKYFQAIGVRQFVLSAMEQDMLEECLSYQKIDHFFEHVSGLDNHYATSKLENAHRLIAGQNLNASELILIGDTVHDFEVATELGCLCILIANGHQSKKVLQSTGALVYDRLSQLLI
ncbi:MAG: HAD family hydrolase [Prolixibacteraceae bacterium]|nr:HAD family hydrolase [Prolixibacteraceae bacterium]